VSRCVVCRLSPASGWDPGRLQRERRETKVLKPWPSPPLFSHPSADQAQSTAQDTPPGSPHPSSAWWGWERSCPSFSSSAFRRNPREVEIFASSEDQWLENDSLRSSCWVFMWWLPPLPRLLKLKMEWSGKHECANMNGLLLFILVHELVLVLEWPPVIGQALTCMPVFGFLSAPPSLLSQQLGLQKWRRREVKERWRMADVGTSSLIGSYRGKNWKLIVDHYNNVWLGEGRNTLQWLLSH